MHKKLIPAVAYYRMSSEDQKEELSIEQQKKDVRQYAEQKGYLIVKEYTDAGKSASKDTEKRVAFQQMLLDSNKKTFTAILCWSTSRFTRLDGIDASFAKSVLRANGVYLDTVKDGKRDWNTFEGRIADAVSTEMDHKYSRDLARLAVRGKDAAFQSNRWASGNIPFGYMRRYSNGAQEYLVKRKEAFRKPRGWTLDVLVDETEANVVRFIFETFAGRDLSFGMMVKLLHDKGYPTPDGRPWHLSGLRYILRNKAYIGIVEIGSNKFSRAGRGHFARMVKGEKEGIIPVIIDRTTFETVQAKLNRRKKAHCSPHGKSIYSPLCGVVYCGHCNYKMSRCSQKKRGKTYLRDKCHTYHTSPSLGCHGWAVADDEILPRVVEKLVKEVDWELIKTMQAKNQEQAVNDLTVLDEQAKHIRSKLDIATERYLCCPKSHVEGVLAKMDKYKEELEEVELRRNVLLADKQEMGLGGMIACWEQVKEKLIRFVAVNGKTSLVVTPEKERTKPDETIAQTVLFDDGAVKFDGEQESEQALLDCSQFRELLHRAGVKVILHFKPKPGEGKTAEWRRKKNEEQGKEIRSYYQVDWEKSRIAVNFTWDNGEFRVYEDSSLTSLTDETVDAVIIHFDRVFA